MADDEKARFKTVVREVAEHLVKSWPGRTGHNSTAFHIDQASLTRAIEQAIFAGAQITQPPNALALAGALRGCVEYINKAAQHGALDLEKLRATGMLPPQVMAERWLQPLDNLFLKSALPPELVEESSLPAHKAPPAQASEK